MVLTTHEITTLYCRQVEEGEDPDELFPPRFFRTFLAQTDEARVIAGPLHVGPIPAFLESVQHVSNIHETPMFVRSEPDPAAWGHVVGDWLEWEWNYEAFKQPFFKQVQFWILQKWENPEEPWSVEVTAWVEMEIQAPLVENTVEYVFEIKRVRLASPDSTETVEEHVGWLEMHNWRLVMTGGEFEWESDWHPTTAKSRLYRHRRVGEDEAPVPDHGEDIPGSIGEVEFSFQSLVCVDDDIVE